MLLVSRAEVMVDRGSRGHSYLSEVKLLDFVNPKT